MIRDRILCAATGQEFKGSTAEAVAAGWRFEDGSWCAPAPGWARFQDARRRAISRDRVPYDNGVDFDPSPLNFGCDR